MKFFFSGLWNYQTMKKHFWIRQHKWIRGIGFLWKMEKRWKWYTYTVVVYLTKLLDKRCDYYSIALNGSCYRTPKIQELYVTDCERDVSVSIMVKSAISHLHPNIGMQVLHTVLYTFPMELASRSCLTIKSFLSFRTFPLFSWT